MGSRIPALTRAQRLMVIESEPDEVTGKEGVGVELRGNGHRVAAALVKRGLGHLEGVGGSLPGMYWNNAAGLAVRVECVRRAEIYRRGFFADA